MTALNIEDYLNIFFAGTVVLRGSFLDFVPDAGVIFSLSKWRIPLIHARGLTYSNGIAWNVDNTQLYIADAAQRIIFAFDFQVEHGVISEL